MYRAIQKTIIALGAALLLLIGGYSLGRADMLSLSSELPAENAVSVQPDYAQTSAPLNANVQTNPIIKQETIPAYRQYDEAVEDERQLYTLKREGDLIYIVEDSTVVTQFSIPDDLDSDAIDALDVGMTFETLEDIECWLESFDS